MSQESISWLNRMTLIGFTAKRGNAWHYKADEQGTEPNHYEDAVPVEDVHRRLFNFEAVERPIFVGKSQNGSDGSPIVRAIPGHKAIVASDNGDVLGIFKDGYKPHQFGEWLVEKVSYLVDDGLSIGSAGLLRNRAQAWVSIEMPENITTPEGVVFRPNLLATTSFDGSISSTYKRVVTLVVCDNTREMALGEKGQQLKVKHTRNSDLKLADAREALGIVHTMADDFAAEVAKLTSVKVTDTQFGRVLDILNPRPEDEGRSQSIADRKRDEIITLYRQDERCAPWRGTAFGVVQTFNTWQQHLATVKGERTRAQRNMENTISNVGGNFDRSVLDAVLSVVEPAPVLAGSR